MYYKTIAHRTYNHKNKLLIPCRYHKETDGEAYSRHSAMHLYLAKFTYNALLIVFYKFGSKRQNFVHC